MTEVLATEKLSHLTCLEPACGRGDMAVALQPYFKKVVSSDVNDYGFGKVRDFIAKPYRPASHDFVITNSPFNRGPEFVIEAHKVARIGFAIIQRIQFLEGRERYETLWASLSPTVVAVFTQRVPMFRGRVDPQGSTATCYAWYVWLNDADYLNPKIDPRACPVLYHIPLCRDCCWRLRARTIPAPARGERHPVGWIENSLAYAGRETGSGQPWPTATWASARTRVNSPKNGEELGGGGPHHRAIRWTRRR